VRGQWGESFERRCGFWRGFVDEQVRRYLDCGLFENGCARIRCPDCAEEYLLAFSCKTRELCPSCAAKRSAATAALLAEEVFKEVGHAQWVFVMPKMLRPYFLHHRALLGGLAHAAWETVLKLMCVAVGALHRDVPGTALCRNDHPASGALRTMPCRALRGKRARHWLFRLGWRPSARYQRGRRPFGFLTNDHADGATLGRQRRPRRPELLGGLLTDERTELLARCAHGDSCVASGWP